MAEFTDEQVVACFKTIDASGDGFIQKSELEKAIKALAGELGWSEEEQTKRIEQAMKDADTVGTADGKISLEEFKCLACSK